MGVTIYYDARRLLPLTADEHWAIESVVRRYSLGSLIAESGTTAAEFDGEDFCVYAGDDLTERDVIFEGATKLPLCSEDAFWAAVQYWCALLTEVRRVLPDAAWTVSVDDAPIPWREAARKFDPSP